MTRWLIEIDADDPPDDVDQFVEHLEAALGVHVANSKIVHKASAVNPLEWTHAMLEGIVFTQNMLFTNPERNTLKAALLNLANIALTFYGALDDGAYTEFGVREAIQPDASTIQADDRQAPEIQGSSQELPEPAHD